jgi:lipopolysaccharide biosynthesis regulator YciM
MSGGIPMIQDMINRADEDMKRIEEHKRRFLTHIEQVLSAAKRRRNDAAQLKEYLQSWGAQDEKVTAEWA